MVVARFDAGHSYQAPVWRINGAAALRPIVIAGLCELYSMIPKSGCRFSEKIMLQQ
jgi:hypothetical protein